ncbi:hypothetical protein C8J56DRAFT_890096 [Mycena floridula]|nr:hypothetical protein C8J56DRAFT_890096 [Mycena floridula]
MAEKKKNMLFIGGAGYIGGPIMSRFLERPDSNFNITTLVRPGPKAAKLQALTTELPVKIEVVIGSHKELDLVERLSANSDVVFSLVNLVPASNDVAADSDALETERKACFPPMSYTTTWISPKLKVSNRLSLIETLILRSWKQIHKYFLVLYMQSILRGGAIILGEGKNITTSIDVNEIADFMELLFNSITSNQVAHGRNGYYFLVNGNATFDEIASVIEDKAVPRRPVTQAELAQYYPGRVIINRFFGDNCRAVAEKARAMGWKPVKTAEDFLNALRNQIVAMNEGEIMRVIQLFLLVSESFNDPNDNGGKNDEGVDERDELDDAKQIKESPNDQNNT